MKVMMLFVLLWVLTFSGCAALWAIFYKPYPIGEVVGASGFLAALGTVAVSLVLKVR